MATFNDATFALAHEKAKQQGLSEQEIQAIDTARTQLKIHTGIGGMAAATSGFLLGKRRKSSPFQLLAITAGCYFMGAQMGIISGVISGTSTLRALPNPKRVIGAIRDAQKEIAYGNHNPTNNKTVSHETSIDQNERAQFSSLDSFATNSNDNDHAKLESGFEPNDSMRPSSWGNKRSEQLSGTSTEQIENSRQSTKPHTTTTTTSAWDEVRAKNLPNNTWTRLRIQAQQNSDAGAVRSPQERMEAARRLKEQREFGTEEMPRTREETEQRSTTRKNQWGDAI
ncbi:hypothetical protein J3Q64DRAFT_1839763 [Phycomyces blakesleeanus]|uniref:Uncharacterized protein n=2 Tax=Phycomyces blakesleeanus TaxID=4837 RepID=A0A167LVV7_PHYB8|nr:hypothetical protein PHYBLDRAFT_170569 [Phycomyces blakesleeanus NRRL 1555(-)]OAD71194.1 hypothetical protein PHYBLDRAFT_170569 [Phycomyces blakesleeanus NRRL 1555(-)]|eukprot:XP_018289234.1 hypothetical protein PHYBLDRAFT_170569 [Phycomyces blakesleeanus NRRL 1555(-)]